jgi:hypothetical protein
MNYANLLKRSHIAKRTIVIEGEAFQIARSVSMKRKLAENTGDDDRANSPVQKKAKRPKKSAKNARQGERNDDEAVSMGAKSDANSQGAGIV